MDDVGAELGERDPARGEVRRVRQRDVERRQEGVLGHGGGAGHLLAPSPLPRVVQRAPRAPPRPAGVAHFLVVEVVEVVVVVRQVVGRDLLDVLLDLGEAVIGTCEAMFSAYQRGKYPICQYRFI